MWFEPTVFRRLEGEPARRGALLLRDAASRGAVVRAHRLPPPIDEQTGVDSEKIGDPPCRSSKATARLRSGGTSPTCTSARRSRCRRRSPSRSAWRARTRGELVFGLPGWPAAAAGGAHACFIDGLADGRWRRRSIDSGKERDSTLRVLWCRRMLVTTASDAGTRPPVAQPAGRARRRMGKSLRSMPGARVGERIPFHRRQ